MMLYCVFLIVAVVACMAADSMMFLAVLPWGSYCHKKLHGMYFVHVWHVRH
jgi:hypothetical protein